MMMMISTSAAAHARSNAGESVFPVAYASWP
ncbi:MAG: hypothetical protein JWN54_3704 [Mycobacterium sp.]|nr:hypothetical protein [Mycobacterium sp.]